MEDLRPREAFAFLLGRWRVEREVSGQARMTGRLTVLETGEGRAEYHERMSVRTTAGVEFYGSQRYGVTRLEDGFILRFAQTGAVFEEIRFTADLSGELRGGELRAEVEHLCAEDLYRSLYVFGPGRMFSVRHEVHGPRKDYVSLTSFYAEDEGSTAWPSDSEEKSEGQ